MQKHANPLHLLAQSHIINHLLGHETTPLVAQLAATGEKQKPEYSYKVKIYIIIYLYSISMI